MSPRCLLILCGTCLLQVERKRLPKAVCGLMDVVRGTGRLLLTAMCRIGDDERFERCSQNCRAAAGDEGRPKLSMRAQGWTGGDRLADIVSTTCEIL